jgi:hypothetical protein
MLRFASLFGQSPHPINLGVQASIMFLGLRYQPAMTRKPEVEDATQQLIDEINKSPQLRRAARLLLDALQGEAQIDPRKARRLLEVLTRR